jgi:hypothetical protein
MLSVPTISTLTGWGEKGKQRNKAGGNGGSGKLVHAGAGGSLLAAWRMHPRAARVCRIRRRATQQRRRCAGAPEWWTPWAHLWSTHLQPSLRRGTRSHRSAEATLDKVPWLAGERGGDCLRRAGELLGRMKHLRCLTVRKRVPFYLLWVVSLLLFYNSTLLQCVCWFLHLLIHGKPRRACAS